MTWLPEATIGAELNRLGGHLQPVVQDRVQALRRIIGAEPSTTVGRALAEVFPDAANDEARRRALLRLVDTINEVAQHAGVAVRLVIDGAKREGDRRRVGFVRPSKPQPGGRADLAESVDLPWLGARQAELPSLKPKIRLALFSAEADLKDIEQLWRRLREALGVSREYEFVIREPHSDVRAGDEPKKVFREALQWADYLMLGLSTSLLGDGGWQQTQPDLVQRFIDAGRCVPVALRTLPEHCDLRSFNGKRVFGRDGTRSRAFFEVAARSRDTFAVALANELHGLIARQATEPSNAPAGADWRQDQARSRTLDWNRVLHRPSLTSAATKGFQAGRTTADIPDVERFLLDWALDPASTSLLALLGDSGIGKTISAQRLVSGLWERPGALTAHYFDLRDLSGIAGWVGVPPVQDVLAACVASGWTESGRPLDLDAARTRVADLLADSKIWPTVLVVDGLDEVLVHLSASDGQKFTNQLLRLRPSGADPIVGTATKLVLTCRTHYFTNVQSQIAHFRDQNRGQIRKDDYTALALLPVTRAQVARYLAEAMGWDEPRVEAFLRSVHDLWDLGSRPFLLSQLADVIPELHDRQARGDTIVAATVYEAMVQQWLARDSGKHVIRTEHKPAIMAYVSYRLWTAGSRSADVRALGDWLFDFVAAERLERQYAGTPAGVLANDLHTATFLVRYDEDQLGLFRFAHSSMAEYFLATWMVRCVEQNDRDGWAMPIPSRETLQFFTELLAGHPKRARLLGVLAGWRAPYCRQASEVLLACGIHAWSTGSIEIPLTRIDLHGADLRGLRVRGSAQRPVNLAGADLRGANLDRSQFDHVVLRGANLTGTVFNRAVWNEVVTTGSQARDMQAAGALLRRCGPSFAPAASSVRIVEPSQSRTRPPHASLVPLSVHTGGVLAVALSADGGRIVSGGVDGTVRVWDAVTGECRATLTGHIGGVSAVAVSGDGSRIVSGDRDSDDGSVSIWDAVTGKCQATLTGHTGWVRAVAVSGDGSRIVSVDGGGDGGGHGTVRIWDAVTGECQGALTGHVGWVLAVALSADGGRIVSGGVDGTVRVWDAATGECEAILIGHTGGVWAVAVSGDGKRIVSGSDDGTVRIWDPDTGECQLTLTGHSDWVQAVAVAGDGKRIVSAGDDGTVRIWDPDTGECQLTLTGRTGMELAVAISADGRRIVSGSGTDTVRVWDAETGECQLTLTGHSGMQVAVAVSGDGRRIVSGGDDGTVRIWDPDTGQCQRVLTGHTDEVWAVAVSGEGRRIVSVSIDGTVRVWDSETGDCQRVLTGHAGAVFAVAVSGDGRRIVSGGDDETVRVWDSDTGDCQRVLTGHTGAVFAVAVSGDGRRIVSGGSDDETVRVWDSDTGDCQRVLTGHTGAVAVAVAVSADGTRLVSASGDGRVKICDPLTGQCPTTLAAVGESWAAWTEGDSAQLLGAAGDAWRWLRVRVLDDRGRLLSQDPYEWYFPTSGLL